MKPSRQPPRTPSRLSDSLLHNINVYALTASATGVSLLALARPVEAKIVYTKTHQVIGSNGIYPLDLKHDGTIDFLIQERIYSTFAASQPSALWVKEAFRNAVEGSHYLAAALSKGSHIGPRQGFISSKGSLGEVMIEFGCADTCSTRGHWLNVKNRYLGLKFQISGKTHFGWARLSVEVENGKITATLTGYAYETVANKGIDAGQTQGAADGDSASPDLQEAGTSGPVSASHSVTPASLGVLALGTPGIPLWRRP
jgi:hypothetical protein